MIRKFWSYVNSHESLENVRKYFLRCLEIECKIINLKQ